MSRYKETRNAFVMSVMVILLCLIALTGSTFALFTSNPEDGKIGVVTTSGKVKVNIISANTNESIVGNALRFKNESGQGGMIIEPGATVCTEGFKVRNDGNVIINFRMYLTNDSDIDMAAFENSCDFYVTTDPSDPGKMVDLETFSGRLNANDCSQTFYLVLKLKEHVPNGMQGQIFSGIGITVYAVQGNVDVQGMK